MGDWGWGIGQELQVQGRQRNKNHKTDYFNVDLCPRFLLCQFEVIRTLVCKCTLKKKHTHTTVEALAPDSENVGQFHKYV